MDNRIAWQKEQNYGPPEYTYCTRHANCILNEKIDKNGKMDRIERRGVPPAKTDSTINEMRVQLHTGCTTEAVLWVISWIACLRVELFFFNASGSFRANSGRQNFRFWWFLLHWLFEGFLVLIRSYRFPGQILEYWCKNVKK